MSVFVFVHIFVCLCVFSKTTDYGLVFRVFELNF